jgi:phosphopantothenoylcysteine decarboxylase/phosphopantothenate--cysteine ligase
MGVALADEAFKKGAEVTLISTFDIEKPYRIERVCSAEEMKERVEKKLNDVDIVIMAAAVADYKIKDYSEQKIKKNEDETVTLMLTKNPDILQEISKKKGENQIIIGFRAESENLLDYAKAKIDKKGCDYIIANDISRKDIGFGSDKNEIYIIDKEHNVKHFEKADKIIVAKNILEYIVE